MSIRTEIHYIHAKKNNPKHRNGFNRPNENPKRPGTSGRKHDYRRALSEIFGESREIRSEAKENLTRRERNRHRLHPVPISNPVHGGNP